MKIKSDYIFIAIACVLLGIVIALQTKFINNSYLRDLKLTQKTANILAELNSLKEEKEELLKDIESLENQINEIKNSASKESTVVKNLNSELEKYKTFSGFTKVGGQGIIITLDNPPKVFDSISDKNIVLDYKMLLDLLNELNASTAEAISINEQRVISNTEIRLAGTQVNVNNIPISPPFVIKVIGNSDTLDASISQRFGVVQSIRENGYYVEVRKTENLEILPFNGVLKFKYANIVK